MLVTLSSDVSVNPSYVTDLEVDTGKNRVILRMADGRQHSLPCKYQKSIWATRDEYVEKMNAPLMEKDL